MVKSLVRQSLAALFCFAAAVAAPPPQAKTQAPGFYRIAVGGFQVTALYDGYVNLSAGVFRDEPPTTLDALFAERFQDGKRLPTSVNAYLVHTGTSLILIDAGSAQCFGPDAGKLPDALRAAGYTPEQIDAVLLTHMHGDHVCGLSTGEGKIAFPNATVWASKTEADWWLNEANAAKVPADRRGMFKTAQGALAPYRAAGRFKTFAPETEVLPGIRAVATPGHTPGHTSYLISSKGETLLVLGDVVHSIAVQFAHPEASYEYDSDRKQAVATRKAVFAEIVKHGWTIADAHLPFPGIGKLRPAGTAFAFVPVEYGPLDLRGPSSSNAKTAKPGVRAGAARLRKTVARRAGPARQNMRPRTPGIANKKKPTPPPAKKPKSAQ
jgi:glyoxylase-like metal-dependent hydrolase (beta-lactamase superfamily II)